MSPTIIGLGMFVVLAIVGYVGWACGYIAAKADRDDEEAQALLAAQQSNPNNWGASK